MNPFFEYLLKSTASLALFYIVFKLAVSRDKMHTVNRFVLLGILFASAILPLAEIPVLPENRVIPQVEVFRQIVEAPVFNNPLPSVSGEIQTVQPTNTLSVNPVLLIYLFAIILLFVRLTISLFRVAQLIQKAEKQSFQNYMLAVVKDFIQPFSFLRNIVISEKDYTENKEMVITHEYAHIRHFHAVDLVICELFTALHWFNPFVWLLRRDLKLIHEYQADQAVLNKGIDATKYQLLVIEKAVGERRFAMANHFKQKPILKRIKMMNEKKLNRWNGLKMILFVPVALLLLQAFAQPKISSEKSEIFNTNSEYAEKRNELMKDTVKQSTPLKGKNESQVQSGKNSNSPKVVHVFSVILKNDEKELDLDNIRTKAEEAMKESDGTCSAIIKAEEGVSDESISSVKAILKKTGIKKISYALPPIIISIIKNGEIIVVKDNYSFENLDKNLSEISSLWKNTYSKEGFENLLTANVNVGVNVSDKEVARLKNSLRKANILIVNYSTDFTQSE